MKDNEQKIKNEEGNEEKFREFKNGRGVGTGYFTRARANNPPPPPYPVPRAQSKGGGAQSAAGAAWPPGLGRLGLAAWAWPYHRRRVIIVLEDY